MSTIRTFILRTGLFLLILLVATVGLEMGVRRLPNSYKYKWEWMERHAGEVETLVLGSSHTLYGVLPGRLDGKAFNLAGVMQTPLLDWWLLTHFSDRYRRLRTVIVPISVFTWTMPPLQDDPNESYRCRYYRLYMHCPLFPATPKYSLEVAHLPSLRWRVGELFKAHPTLDCDTLGYGLTQTRRADDADSRLAEAADAARRHQSGSNGNAFMNGICLKAMAEWCRGRGVRMVLLTTPCEDIYRRQLSPATTSAMNRRTRSLAARYRLRWLNHLDDPRFTGNDFIDSDHLSPTGAEKLTRLINEELKRPSTPLPTRAPRHGQCRKSPPDASRSASFCR